MSRLIGADAFSRLFMIDARALHQSLTDDELPIVGGGDMFDNFMLHHHFDYCDALMFEVARQIHDEGGLPLAVASKIVWNGSDLSSFKPGSVDDHWLAIVRSRNTWSENEPRGSWPVTLFGAGEYWSSAYFAGPFASVQNELQRYVDDARGTDSDPARILIANVSAADRRLRRRAAELGIDLD